MLSNKNSLLKDDLEKKIYMVGLELLSCFVDFFHCIQNV